MSSAVIITLFTLIALSNLTSSEQMCDGCPTISIAQGRLRGRTNVTAEGTEYYMYLGIPYASPPVRRLRFVSPRPAKTWSGVRDAGDFGSVCFQVNESSVVLGSEDCLLLNVFTPKRPSRDTTLLPVMVWIHGGAFVSGSGNIYPGQLLDRGIVVVSMNYRLNVFGFLSVDGTDATGNAGLKDQSAALRWVQKNIVHFGGDRHSVTIFGQSAGGASVHYHLLSPMSRGLFHRAISESASALSPWAFSCRTQDRAFSLGYVVGRGANSTQGLVDNLRATPAGVLTSALAKVLTQAETKRLLSFPFMPTMEHRRAGETPFLLQSPEFLESSGSFAKVPYILGVNVREARLFTPENALSQPSYWKKINNDLEQIVPSNLGLPKGSYLSLEVAKRIKEFYFGNQEISYDTKDRWINLQSDLLFVLGVQKTINSHARFSNVVKTYSYEFVYNNATHTDELPYVFYPGKYVGGESNEAKVARLFGTLWTSFSKKGAPASGNDLTWKPVSKTTHQFLKISTSLTLDSDLENEAVEFWTNIYRNFRQSGPRCT